MQVSKFELENLRQRLVEQLVENAAIHGVQSSSFGDPKYADEWIILRIIRGVPVFEFEFVTANTEMSNAMLDTVKASMTTLETYNPGIIGLSEKSEQTAWMEPGSVYVRLWRVESVVLDPVFSMPDDFKLVIKDGLNVTVRKGSQRLEEYSIAEVKAFLRVAQSVLDVTGQYVKLGCWVLDEKDLRRLRIFLGEYSGKSPLPLR